MKLRKIVLRSEFVIKNEKNVEILWSHDAFSRKIGKPKNRKVFGRKTTTGSMQESQNIG